LIVRILAALCVLVCAPAFGQDDLVPGSTLEISLLTVGPGEIYFERFGHNAIVVRDSRTDRTIAYNYGLFDFDQEDFFLNFARGRMQYLIAANSYEDDLAFYRSEGRSIVEQPLALTPAQRVALRDYLEWNARPENATYRYDYFVANCSTRVRDVLDRVVGGAIREQTRGRSRGYTYRLDALRLMAPQPALMLLIDLGLGPFADQRLDLWQESFVPMAFSDALADVNVPVATGHPLAGTPRVVAESRIGSPPALPPDLRVAFLVLGIAIGLSVLALGHAHRRRGARIALFVVGTLCALFCGLGGLVLLALWGLTDHVAAWRNENLFLLDPLCLWLVPAWLCAARARWRPGRGTVVVAACIALLAAFALFSKILPWFVQANVHWIALWLPIHLAFAIVLARRRRDCGDPTRAA
jgi:hypothetical protein